MYQDSNNFISILLFNTILVPFIASVTIIFLIAKVSPFAKGIGLSISLLVTLNQIHSSLQFPPANALDFLSTTALIGAGSSLVTHFPHRVSFKSFKTILLFISAFSSAFLLLNPVLKHGQNFDFILIPLFITLTLQATLALLSTEKLEQNKNHILSIHSTLINLIITASASALLVAMGGSIIIGQLIGGFTAILCAYLLVCLRRRESSEEITFFTLLVLSGLLSQANILAEISLNTIVLLWLCLWVLPLTRYFTEAITIRFFVQLSFTAIIVLLSL